MNLYKYIVHTHRKHRDPTEEEFEVFAEDLAEARKKITKYQCFVFDWKRWHRRGGLWHKETYDMTYSIRLYAEPIMEDC